MTLTSTQIGRRLVEELVRLGVHDWVISPGSRSAPIALAAAELAGRIHVRIDERSAAFLALGLGRGDGRPAAVVCSSGTATANYLPAVVEADAAGVPLIVVTADRPPEVRGTGANQTIDQVGIYGDVVRYAVDLDPGDRGAKAIVEAAVRAVDLAHGVTNRGPGPVHLNVPLREPLLDADVDVGGATVGGGSRAGVEGLPSAVPPPRGHARPHRWTSASERSGGAPVPDFAGLLAGRTAAVVVGEGADAGVHVVGEATRLGLPVLAEPTSGARVEGALRCGHWLAATEAFLSANRPEVVVQLGRPVLSRPVGALIAGAEDVITIDPEGRGWDPGRHTTHRVDQRFEDWVAAAPDGDPAFLRSWRAADAVAGEVLDADLDAASGMTELGATRDLADAVPDGGQLVVASSLAIRHLNEVMRPRAGVRVIGNRGASGIDGFTSTAIGAALGYVHGPTAALAGDLSILHDMTGLVVGRDEPLPSLPIVVLNNDGGGIFDLLPYGARVDPTTFRRLFATPHGIPLEALALTTGHGHTHVDDPAELPQVLADAWSSPGITIIEVRTDTSTETARHRRITRSIGAALTG